MSTINESLSENWRDPWERMYSGKKGKINDSNPQLILNKTTKSPSPAYTSSDSESNSKSFSRSRSSSSSSRSSRSSSGNSRSSGDIRSLSKANFKKRLQSNKGSEKGKLF